MGFLSLQNSHIVPFVELACATRALKPQHKQHRIFTFVVRAGIAVESARKIDWDPGDGGRCVLPE